MTLEIACMPKQPRLPSITNTGMVDGMNRRHIFRRAVFCDVIMIEVSVNSLFMMTGAVFIAVQVEIAPMSCIRVDCLAAWDNYDIGPLHNTAEIEPFIS